MKVFFLISDEMFHLVACGSFKIVHILKSFKSVYLAGKILKICKEMEAKKHDFETSHQGLSNLCSFQSVTSCSLVKRALF